MSNLQVGVASSTSAHQPAESTRSNVRNGTAETVVEVRNIRKTFGGVIAVNDVSFDVYDGEILGVIGPNGCGKSTMFNCVLGQYQPDTGSVKLGGKDVSKWSPTKRAKAGLARTFQLLQVFPTMSVRDNLKLAAQEHVGSIGKRLFSSPDLGLNEHIDGLIERFRIGHLADELAGNLSYGQQKLLDTAMAIVSGPKVVFLDEPAGGVNLTMLADVEHQIVDLNAKDGTTFVVVEHNMDFIMRIAHRVIVMMEGFVLMTGSPAEVMSDPRVIEAYLGE
jgi:branched-chain amino acid transport system ATP-binding protein